jgi:hypothetical protein
MQDGGELGQVEFAVLNAVHRGALRSRRTATQIPSLRREPAGDAILHEVLHRCERDGMLRSQRGPSGRRYELTAAGRARLRADRRFRLALIGVLVRGERSRERLAREAEAPAAA